MNPRSISPESVLLICYLQAWPSVGQWNVGGSDADSLVLKKESRPPLSPLSLSQDLMLVNTQSETTVHELEEPQNKGMWILGQPQRAKFLLPLNCLLPRDGVCEGNLPVP